MIFTTLQIVISAAILLIVMAGVWFILADSRAYKRQQEEFEAARRARMQSRAQKQEAA
jgi:hypothetical protein